MFQPRFVLRVRKCLFLRVCNPFHRGHSSKIDPILQNISSSWQQPAETIFDLPNTQPTQRSTASLVRFPTHLLLEASGLPKLLLLVVEMECQFKDFICPHDTHINTTEIRRMQTCAVNIAVQSARAGLTINQELRPRSSLLTYLTTTCPDQSVIIIKHHHHHHHYHHHHHQVTSTTSGP